MPEKERRKWLFSTVRIRADAYPTLLCFMLGTCWAPWCNTGAFSLLRGHMGVTSPVRSRVRKGNYWFLDVFWQHFLVEKVSWRFEYFTCVHRDALLEVSIRFYKWGLMSGMWFIHANIAQNIDVQIWILICKHAVSQGECRRDTHFQEE